MNRFVSKTLATGIACAGLMAMLVSWRVAAEDDAVIAADKVVVAALAKADKVSADKWLDPDFTWIDSEGIMWAKTDAFRAELKPLLASPSDSQIIEHKYGKSVVWIQWNQGNNYSAHFWMKRATGWKLLHTTEIAAVAKRDFQTVDATYDIPCGNPCKAVPYKPLSPGEKAALDEWQEQESSQANWEKHVANDMDQRVVSSYGRRFTLEGGPHRWDEQEEGGQPECSKGRVSTGAVDPDVGLWRRGRDDRLPANLRRQGVLVEPCARPERRRHVADDGELP
jgi:hypothetical protein